MKNNKLEHIKKSGFKTPKEYFNTLEDAVFTKLTSNKFPKKSGIKVPEGYFNSIEDNVLNKINLKNKETGFKIPDHYLETVEDNVLKNINKKQKDPKVINFTSIFLKKIIPIVAAASLLLFIFINYNQSSDVNLNQLASSEIEQWIDNDLITFDTYEITDVFEDIELEDEPIFEEEELLDYLNGTNIEELILEN
ncbi:hypothetical protein EGM88_01195 [Aureibaculum marinum]|uniref:Uncharacterized protein n=1 Tax=Aureibaculum marinum TaxID=2487930 RepID=A0A3N4P5J1_9FLAO|nr:hypothetical protein [Aureibaculum marinum]RPD99910.1 hypothetical protein EGM88_01195 [Aureibaculum marinum]